MNGSRSSGAGTIGRVRGGAGRERFPGPAWEAGPLSGWRDEEGSATAEYAIATMAAVGFAGLLVVILKGDEVRGILTDLVTRALTSGG
ncbi:DUF4244 domain-containing protein [Rathayibacter sp. VKM Ac-2927]|uniref:DUF4244 domain-containing protein n=1 Tax=Rathayibacter sp. VKM Ac-2927 TaxID=2929478 RepID=UPI0027E025F9|nr:DUF4244 domain-containing protein [Rathayibacter sp. VKM Ac-2927]MCJ1683567.1 DUF4244 domain-containing protein [Rathayibacter sp. VKM Ac-2928]